MIRAIRRETSRSQEIKFVTQLLNSFRFLAALFRDSENASPSAEPKPRIEEGSAKLLLLRRMSLRNGFKARRSLYQLWKEYSVVDSIGASKLRTHHCHQQAKVYSRFPQSIFRKTKEIELSVPSIISLPFSSRSSSAAAAAAKVGLVGWYLELLKTRPILTKSLTCAVIYTAADLSSQVLSLT